MMEGLIIKQAKRIWKNFDRLLNIIIPLMICCFSDIMFRYTCIKIELVTGDDILKVQIRFWFRVIFLPMIFKKKSWMLRFAFWFIYKKKYLTAKYTVV